jgi:hypothetical protein
MGLVCSWWIGWFRGANNASTSIISKFYVFRGQIFKKLLEIAIADSVYARPFVVSYCYNYLLLQ